MNKIALIILISIYTVSSLGIGVRQFYCCGKLSSAAISFEQEGKDKKDLKKEDGKCCKTTYHFFKLRDTHIHAATIISAVNDCCEATISLLPFGYKRSLQQQALAGSPVHAPPPLHNGIPFYIFNCIYRI